MTQKLNKALRDQKQQNKQRELEIYGSLGIPLGGQKLVEVPGRNSYVYVRLRDNQNEVIQAFNNKVATSYDLPVIVHREGPRYVVDSVNTLRYNNNLNNFAAYLPKHGQAHSFFPGGGGDVVWVYSRQMMPLLVYPSPSNTGTNVSVYGQPLIINNQWQYVGNTGTDSLLNYTPTGSNSVMGLIYLDSITGNPGILINSGTPFAGNITGTGDVMPFIPVPNIATQIPLAAVKISSGTSTIGWNNLYDMREWVHAIPSGTFGGGISTGTSSISTPTYPAIYHDGNFVVTGTQIDFTRNVNVSASGTRATIDFPITTYFRVGQPSLMAGSIWQVPDRVYASGSLGVFQGGLAKTINVEYAEHLYVSGTFQFFGTGSVGLVMYGVPCYPQIQLPTGTATGGITDSNGVLMTDSNGTQLVDSNGN